MNDTVTLEERLEELSREVGDNPTLASAVMEQLTTDDVRPRPPRRFLSGRRILTAITAACVILAVLSWFSRPSTLYARAMQALAKARTVHVTGWTSRIVRKWPLNQPQEAKDVRHPVDAWYWRADDGMPRSYEKFGPVVQVRNGPELKEYQQDVDLLFISEGSKKDHLEMFSTVAAYLRELDAEGLKKEDLGTRTEDGKTIRGLKVARNNRTEEYWFDTETDLPVRFSRSQKESDDRVIGFEMNFTYNDPVPAEVAEYTPPEAGTIHYGGRHKDVQLAWRRYVQDIGVRLQEQPPEGGMVILPRDGQQTFASQWQLLTPDGQYWVVPLDLDQYFPLTVHNFINLRVATPDGERAFEYWRMPDDIREMEFPLSDLAVREDTPWQQWVQFALNENGLEYVDVQEDRTIWVAHHDGRKLKPWRTVDPPVPYIVKGGKVKKGVVRPGIGHQLSPETMHGLFEDFNRIQNNEFKADHPIIIDETGLPQPPPWNRDQYPHFVDYRKEVLEDYFVASDSPYFAREESRQMARDWFRTEFGVTFTEERRPVTIHVIRRTE